MSRRTPRSHQEVEYGPLGPGSAPVKDPIKGLSGVLSGTLVMEAITIWLCLTVILKINEGEMWTTFNWVFITVMGFAHFIAAFLQRRPGALWIDVALQVPLIVIGFFIHWSVGAVGIMFGIVWFLIVKMRADILERQRRGLLTTQHLGTADEG
ncbi:MULTISPECIES: DUF4233 domain-containing protein [unclassified Corynebacterium]|uniref:DUF4233 domain-containing protein n=1 Tax=unclassified Corynebacterium TaxID=2624378 RepID=UPI0021AB07AE|nr:MULTISPECIES: DUF4233 domain-containing protein [unclassified Corynebacterium]MCT1452696.1 DUF4233 domain-containing protein [Corynebacterium sp. p3-SID1145]MCT1461598.1 DUF4233 domain-containing protein [Corynebacterium sp. p3-SID1140]MDN8594595.1 DUF4233 domain-containing protein [Corynebacterium sp. P4_F2]WKK55561.1 DUF4233 domain-containing protein [Corynebacterium sp. P4-C1]WKK62971.1 DUF4233 domain-containing protein [Corynebacterium sp. P8-C1]